MEAEGAVSCIASPTTIQEQYIGTYDATILHIIVGKQKVSFYPKGALIGGAEGRVDVMGQKSMQTLLLNKREWSIVETPRKERAKVEFEPFAEESFQRLMEEVME